MARKRLSQSKSEKQSILTFVRYYLPGYKSGGPVRTIANMVEHLGDKFEFKIVTSDRDALDDEAYTEVEVDQWNQVGKAQVYYLSPESLKFSRIVDLINKTEHDLLYLNSFFDPTFTIKPLLARKLKRLFDKPVIPQEELDKINPKEYTGDLENVSIPEGEETIVNLLGDDAELDTGTDIIEGINNINTKINIQHIKKEMIKIDFQ